MNTLIVGCGAAGAAAAIAAAQKGDSVTVLERNRKALKKLGVSGNGRGNLLNVGPLCYYGDSAFAGRVLTAMPPQSVRAFWEALGVPLVTDGEGRAYPAAYLASVAVDALRARMDECGVKIVESTKATAIRPVPGGFEAEAVQTVYEEQPKGKKPVPAWESEQRFFARRVIVAAGGQAAPAHGTDGQAYALLTALGHTLLPTRPALCALLSDAPCLRALEGQRVRAGLCLRSREGRVLHATRGEALFTADGVSGIAAMQLARFYQPGCALEMDLREAVFGDPSASPEALLSARAARYPARAPTALLLGAATPALSRALCAGGNPASAISAFCLPVTGVRGFAQAQVTAGGIDTREFSAHTLESQKIPGLYAAGEMLNVDGDCGGFNLLFAVASGLLAGAHSPTN